jgi:hypothetical protein
MIHFRIRDDTLCGADYTEPNKKAAKNGRLCNECIQVIWQEQYRRNTLLAYVKKVGNLPPTPLDEQLKADMREAWSEPTDMSEHDSHSPALYLCDFGNEVLTI